MKDVSLLDGTVISSYPPDVDDLTFITTAQPLLRFLAETETILDAPSCYRRMACMAILKLATLRMTSSDCWILELFGTIIVKNWVLKHRSIKKNATHIWDTHFNAERQDLWGYVQSLEALSIAIRGLANVSELLLHPCIITATEIMDLFRKVVNFFDRLQSRSNIECVHYIMKTHIDEHLAALRHFLHTQNATLQPRINVITPTLELHP